jgi:DNA-binding PadR family transcriptional regulator
MSENINKFLPLSPANLHILVALAGGELHGYGIMQEVHSASNGRYKLGPGTLYDNLQRLLDDGLVQETARRDADPRRRYYRLTSLGKSIVAAEIERLEIIFKKVKSQLYGRQARNA